MRVKIESFLREVCEKTTKNNEYPVLTSLKSGLFLQSDYFNKQVASTDNTGYKIIKKGQFTYRAMSDTGEFYPNMLECVDVGIVSPAYPVFEIFQTDIIIPEYLKYYFKSNAFQHAISSFAQGSTRTSVKFNKLKTASIDLPSKQEQTKILRLLKKAETLIACRQQELHKLDDLVKARFVEMFGDPENNSFDWKEQPLSKHLDVVGGFAFKSDQFVEEGIPVLRIGNINAGYFKPVNMVFWDNDDNLKKYKLFPGDLVMSLTGTVGKDDYGNVCILGNDYDEYYLNQRNAKLELKDSINKYYISTLLKFESIKKKLTGISRGIRQANISNKDILNLVVPIPNITTQIEFEQFVQQIDKSKFVESIHVLKLIKEAIAKEVSHDRIR